MSKKSGPKEDRLVLPGDWKGAVRKTLSKKKPPSGWPEKGKKPKKGGSER